MYNVTGVKIQFKSHDFHVYISLKYFHTIRLFPLSKFQYISAVTRPEKNAETENFLAIS